MSTMKDRPTGRPLRFCVGVSEVVPKLVAFRLLEPALRLRTPLRLICREDRPDHLFADLATHELDVVLSDSPANPVISVRAFSHLLSECSVSFFAPKKLKALKKKFPRSLDGAPFLLPLENAALRRDLNEWFYLRKIQPIVLGEFADFALLRVFAAQGFGIFAAPSIIDGELALYGFEKIGTTTQMKVRFYAISAETQVEHPAVLAVCNAQRTLIRH